MQRKPPAPATALPPGGHLCWIDDIAPEERAAAAPFFREGLARAVETCAEGIVILDREGRLRLVNAAVERILGQPREQILGRRYDDPRWSTTRLDGQPVPPEEAAITRTLNTGEVVYGAERLVVHPDGLRVIMAMNTAPLRDAAGQVVGVVASLTDITRRKAAEEDARRAREELEARVLARTSELYAANEAMREEIARRRQAEADLLQERTLLRSLLDNLPDHVYFKDRDSRFLRINRAKAARMGLSDPAQAVGKTDADFHPADFSRQTFEDEQEVLRTGRPLLDKEELVRYSDGTAMWVSATKAPLRDMVGQVVGTFGISRDITARKRAEAALRASEASYRLLFERNLAGVIRSRVDGQILDCNESFAQMLGYASREEVLARRAWDYYLDRAEREAMLEVLRREGAVRNYELRLRRRDGQTAWALGNVCVLDGEGEQAGLQGVFVDITPRKRLEEQLLQSRKMEAVGQLAGGIAHDFNNILTVINGFSDILLDRLGPHDPSYELIDLIRKAGDRAAALTSQLLSFGRKQLLAPRVVDLNLLLGDVEGTLQRLIGEDVRLLVRVAPEPCPVRVDPAQLTQVILNLAANARDAMPQGGGLTLATELVDLDERRAADAEVRPGSYVCLSVADTGCGMDEVTQAHLFEPFFTTKELGRGTGLGLAAVYGLVKQSEGHIDVTSAPRQGTTFRLYLPRAAEPAARPAAGAPAQPAGKAEVILLVEDDKLVRQLLARVLSRDGYRVLTAGGGNEAFERFREHDGRVDLLVTDVVMPGLSGGELARRLKHLKPGLRVLYLSGYNDDALVRHGIGEEETAFLPKPFGNDMLLRKVRELLDAEKTS